MMKAKTLLFVLAFGATAATAEVSVRECILYPPGSNPDGHRIVVPASSSVDLASMQFQINSASDAIFEVAILYQDSNTPPSSRARYSVVIDSGAYNLGSPAEYYMRSPVAESGNLHLRAFFQNIPSGLHTAKVRVINTSTSALEIGGVWITPLFVDAAETGVINQRFTAQSSSSTSWTTLGVINVPATANRSLILSAYARGNAPGAVNFRFRSGATVLESFAMNFRNRDDGGIFNYIYEHPTPGSQVVFEAMGQASYSFTELAGQPLLKYTLLDGHYPGPGLSIPSNFAGHDIAVAPEEFLNPLSLSGPPAADLDQFQTCLWGHAYSQMSKAVSTMVRLDARLAQNGVYFSGFDIGLAEHAPDSVSNIYRNQVDFTCGAGLYSNRSYKVGLQAFGACGNGAPIQINRARIQVLVVPSPDPNDHTCTTSFEPGCPHVCQLNTALSVIPGPPRNWCDQ